MLTPEVAQKVERLSALYRKKRLILPEVLARVRQFLTSGNFAAVVELLPPDLAEAVKPSMVLHPPLKAIGYWYSHPNLLLPQNDRFPDPTRLVQADWRVKERPRILGYLRSGWEYAAFRGLSYCRFRCGVDYSEMGSRCLTDGEWVWPEGLQHYIERHSVRLPEEFIESMIGKGWKVPPGGEPPASSMTHGNPEDSFWVAWGNAAVSGGRS
jgi:hypothetical protein